MRVSQTAAIAMVSLTMIGTVLTRPLVAQGGGKGAPPATHILEPAPTDHSIAIPKEKLAKYFKDMDAAKEETLRMIEGGRFNVNIRRISHPEGGLIHPKTIDLWVVLEGNGTITSGGKVVDGKIVGGVTNPLKTGDVEFIPANLPHAVTAFTGSKFTWLNVRWDSDWPATAKMGAGNAQPAPGAPAPRGMAPKEYAQTDHAVYIPKEKLEAYISEQNATNSPSSTTRMIEGGRFNVNIRNVTEPSIEFHPETADTWVILQGAGTAYTGYSTSSGDMHTAPGRGATSNPGGVSVPAKVGDVFFVPANLTHGFSTVDGRMVWLNIRYDTNY